MGKNVGRGIWKLSAKFVEKTREVGMHSDGGGLYLRVAPGGTQSWIFRYTRNAKTTDMGLGSVLALSLSQARERAAEKRTQLADGLDPKTERDAGRATASKLWGACVDDFIDAHKAGWKSETQAEVWAQSLKDHGPDRKLPIAAITTAVIVERLRIIWTTKTDTAKRVRARIERVWDSAKVEGLVSGENPARWKGHLDKLLPKPSSVTKPGHFDAMPYKEVPALFVKLATRVGHSATALAFTVLTAARTGETTGASWPEFDKDNWTIPAERMKAGKAHVVPLSKQVKALLKPLPKSKAPFVLSENAMLYMLQKEKHLGLKPYTVHGFRSSFRDWASEETNFPNEVVEMALAHSIRDKAEAAYRRGNLLVKRKELMQSWADYCFSQVRTK